VAFANCHLGLGLPRVLGFDKSGFVKKTFGIGRSSLFRSISDVAVSALSELIVTGYYEHGWHARFWFQEKRKERDVPVRRGQRLLWSKRER
jgi:hypothetical protein